MASESGPGQRKRRCIDYVTFSRLRHPGETCLKPPDSFPSEAKVKAIAPFTRLLSSNSHCCNRVLKQLKSSISCEQVAFLIITKFIYQDPRDSMGMTLGLVPFQSRCAPSSCYAPAFLGGKPSFAQYEFHAEV